MVLGCVYILHKLDISTQPLATPYDKKAPYYHTLPVVMLSYGDGDQTYIQNQNALHLSALNRGIDTMHMLRRDHIDSDFYNTYKSILSQPRGAGYWLWKPYFILRMMESYPDNSIIVYADSGVIFTHDLTPLLKHINQYPRIFVGHGKPVPLSRHVKKEAWSKILNEHDHDAVLNQQNIWAFFMILKNTPENRAYIKKWLDLCTHSDYLTDTPLNPKDQAPDFEYHQHDQSLLSIVEGMDRVHSPNKTHALIIPKDVLRKTYGIYNYHRHPEDAKKSPLCLIAGVPMWVNEWIWNIFR